jgi:hypothetical protein
LSHRRAIQVLEGGGALAEALEELQTAGATVTAHLERAKKSVQRATGLLSDVDAKAKHELQRPYDELKSAIKAFDDAFGGSAK